MLRKAFVELERVGYLVENSSKLSRDGFVEAVKNKKNKFYKKLENKFLNNNKIEPKILETKKLEPKKPEKTIKMIFEDGLILIKHKHDKFVFAGFFEDLQLVCLEDDLLTIAAPTKFLQEYILKHYVKEICDTYCFLFNAELRIRITNYEDTHLFFKPNIINNIYKYPKKTRPI